MCFRYNSSSVDRYIETRKYKVWFTYTILSGLAPLHKSPIEFCFQNNIQPYSKKLGDHHIWVLVKKKIEEKEAGKQQAAVTEKKKEHQTHPPIDKIYILFMSFENFN